VVLAHTADDVRLRRASLFVEFAKHQHTHEQGTVTHNAIRADVGACGAARLEELPHGQLDLLAIVPLEEPHGLLFGSRLAFFAERSDLLTERRLDALDMTGGSDESSWRMRRRQRGDSRRDAEDRNDARMRCEEMEQA
jgi:hypothetical protein